MTSSGRVARRAGGWWLVMACMSACGPSADPMDGGDGGDGGDAAAPTACAAAPITASGAVAYRFHGTAPGTDFAGAPYGMLDETVVLYFPEGTGDGAAVWAAHPVNWPHAGLATSESRIAGGRATVSIGGVDGDQQFSIDGTLDVATGTIMASASRNVAPPWTDVGDYRMGPIHLCNDGEVNDAPGLTWVSRFGEVAGGSPVGPLRFASNLPLDAEASFEVRADERVVPVEVTFEEGATVIRPVDAFPVGSTLSLSIAGTDVLGRALPSLPPRTVASTTGVLADRSLDTEPTEGSVLGRWSEGELRIGETRAGETSSLLVALGVPPDGAAQLRINGDFGACGYRPATRAALVASDGTATEIELPCSDEPTAVHAAIPGEGAVYLAIDIDDRQARPQWLPPPTGLGTIVITELAFE